MSVSAQSIGGGLSLARWFLSHREAYEEIVSAYHELAAIAAKRGQVPWRTVVVPAWSQYRRVGDAVAPAVAEWPEVSLTATDDDVTALSSDAQAMGIDLGFLVEKILPWLVGMIVEYLRSGEWHWTMPELAVA